MVTYSGGPHKACITKNQMALTNTERPPVNVQTFIGNLLLI